MTKNKTTVPLCVLISSSVAFDIISNFDIRISDLLSAPLS